MWMWGLRSTPSLALLGGMLASFADDFDLTSRVSVQSWEL